MKNIKMIKWSELDDYAGKPVWDKNKKCWRILTGYKRNDNYYSLLFSDDLCWHEYNKNKLNLYPKEK